MTKHNIEILCDDEFGKSSYSYQPSNTKNVDGIINISTGGYSIVDPNIFQGKLFFKPVEEILKQNINIKDISLSDLSNILSTFGNYEISNQNDIIFQKDNMYDLCKVSILGTKSIFIQYDNCPVGNFHLMDNGSHIQILFSPFTKTYYAISEYEWYTFLDYLKNDNLSDLRDQKIKSILDDVDDYSNLVRKIKFISKCKRSQSNRFIDSVYGYYKKTGNITKRQADAIAKTIW